jgi:hypothetical protein
MKEFMQIFEGIEISEEQEKALGVFFENYKEKLHKEFMEEAAKNTTKESEEKVDLSKYVLIEDAEKAFDLFEKDAEKAFELFESHAERAFELFEEDSEKAFNLHEEDIRNQYTENMAKAIQEIYSDVEARVKKDFMESKEYKTFEQIKSLVIPTLESDNHELIAKIKQLSEEKEIEAEKTKKLAKDRTIAVLLKDIPAEYSETVKKFIEKGTDEDDVVAKFNAIIEILETKITNESKNTIDEKATFVRKTVKKETETPVTEEANIKTEKQDAEHVFEYESVEISKGEGKQEVNAFTESEREMLTLAGIPV